MGFLIGFQITLSSFQTLAHLCFTTYLSLSIFLPESGWFSSGDRQFLIIIMVTRSFIIGVRYGFMSKARYDLLKASANLGWIINDFLFFGWLQLTPKTLKEEIQAAKTRSQINDDEFEFTFCQELPEELKQKLLKQGKLH